MSIEIKCARCNEGIVHHCHNDLKEAIMKLYSWAPDSLGDEEMHKAFLEHGRRSGWLGEDEDPAKAHKPSPFFGSQAWSYALFGNKEEARSFHAYLDNVVRAAGFDPHDLRHKACEEIHKQNEQHARRQRRMEVVKLVKNMDPATQDDIHACGIEYAKVAFPNGTDEFFFDLIQLVGYQVERRKS